jgi:hypothetical protein
MGFFIKPLRMRSLIKKFVRHIRRNSAVFLLVSGLCTVVIGALVFEADRNLRNSCTPKGIVSLQYPFFWKYCDNSRVHERWTSEKVSSISPGLTPVYKGHVSKEESSVLSVAVNSILLDTAFLVSYTILLCAVIAIAGQTTASADETVSRETRIHASLALVAGGCDFLENVATFYFLKTGSVAQVLITGPAVVKALLLLYLIFGYWFFYKGKVILLSEYLKHFAEHLWTYRVSVVGLLVIYFAIWQASQGQDLLLSLNEKHFSVVFFYGVVTLLAVCNWFLARYYVDRSYSNPVNRGKWFPNWITGQWETTTRSREGYLPQLLGVATFLIPACGILNAFDEMRIPYALSFLSPMILLSGSLVLFAWMMEHDIFENFFDDLVKNGRVWVYHSIIVALLVSVGVFGVFNRGTAQELDLLSVGLYFMAIILVMVSSVRTERAFYEQGLLRPIAKLKDVHMAWPVLIMGALAAGVFVYVNAQPLRTNSYSRYFTLPVVLTGVVFYTMLFWFLISQGKLWKFNLSALVIAIALSMAVFADNRFHDVREASDANFTAYENLDSLSSYARKWVNSRGDEIVGYPRKRYPVFLVNTYGGGVRAAAWTNFVIAHLEKETDYRFGHHVFSYSGASGGTIGAAVSCSIRSAGKTKDFQVDSVENFYKNDFLTPVLVGLFGRDVLFSTLGISNVDDRARLQDQIWERALYKFDGGQFSKEFCSMYYNPDKTKRYDIPLLFSNSTHVEEGLKAVLAPVKIDTAIFTQTIDIRQRLGKRSVPFSTGAFLSARFPFISPAAKLDSTCHFLDGGIKENSAAETSFEIHTLFQQLKRKELVRAKSRSGDRRTRDSTIWNKVEFYFISLNNAGEDDPEPVSRNLVELTAPLSALYNNGFGYAVRADSVLHTTYKRQGRYFQLRPLEKYITCDDISDMRPLLPLGWQISDCSLQRLKQSLKHQQTSRVVQEIKDLFPLAGN